MFGQRSANGNRCIMEVLVTDLPRLSLSLWSRALNFREPNGMGWEKKSLNIGPSLSSCRWVVFTSKDISWLFFQ